MNITIEMVDQVIARTNCTYKEAKEALEKTDGNVLDAIVLLEEEFESVERPDFKEKIHGKFNQASDEVIDKLKELIKKGNINRLLIEKGDKVYMDVPVSAGILGAVFFTPAITVAVIAALASGHHIKLVKESGEVVDFKEYAEGAYETVKEKGQKYSEEIKKKFENTEEAVEEAVEDAVEDVEEFVDEVKDEANNIMESFEESEEDIEK